jgi:hypothetical protein
VRSAIVNSRDRLAGKGKATGVPVATSEGRHDNLSQQGFERRLHRMKPINRIA